MKKIGLIAAAATLAAAGAAFGQSVSLDLRTRTVTATDGLTPATYSNNSPISVDLTGQTSFSIDLYAFVSITGANEGDIWFGGPFLINDDGSGQVSRNAWSQFEVQNSNPFRFPPVVDNTVDSAQTGLFGAWRTVLNLQGDSSEQNGVQTAAGWRVLASNTATDWNTVADPNAVPPVEFSGQGKLYAFTWTTTDTSARTVTITMSPEDPGGSVFRIGTQNVLTPTTNGTFTINIVPAPGAAALLGLGGLVAIRRRR